MNASYGTRCRPVMDTIVFLITISAGVLAFRYKERLQDLVPARQGGQKVLVDRTLGLARLELPAGWRPARDLNETASIEAMNASHGRHVIVISDSVDDFVPEMTVLEHSANTRTELASSIKLIACSGPERRTVGGFESVQYEIEGFFQQTRVKYLHTTVAGRRAFHQVLAWATYSRYDRAAFECLLNGFTELPDSNAASAAMAATEPLQVVPPSQYDFH
jgi:hypothetical protein